MYTYASILDYKFRPERTGFNMYAEYTQQQLTFLALLPWLLLIFHCCTLYTVQCKVKVYTTVKGVTVFNKQK